MAQVLIADDEAGFRFLLARTLAAMGHEVREAAEGDAALICLQTFSAQIVIMDLFMPGKEGIETIIEIRRRYPAIKIIAMSGGTPKNGVSFLMLAQKLGAHETLVKPFSTDELLTVMSHLVENTESSSVPPIESVT